MADEYDGRVIIDTELDNSGFEKGSEKLVASMRSAERAINGIGETAAAAFSAEHPLKMRVEPELPEPDEVSNAVEKIEAELPPIQPHMDSKEYDKTVERLQARTNKLMAEINRMANTTAQGFKSTSAVIAFNNRLDDTAEKIVQARQELAEFGEQQIPTDQYRETTAAIEKAEKALLKLYDKRDALEELGVKESSKQWQRLQMQIQNAEEEVERYEMNADRMRETGEAFINPQATEEYQRMAAEIERAQRALETNAALIRSERIEEAQLAVQTAQTALAEAQTGSERRRAMRELADARAELEAVAEASKDATGEPNPSVWQRFADTLRGAAGVVRTEMQGVAAATSDAIAEARGADASVSIWQRFAGVLREVDAAAREAAMNVGAAAEESIADTWNHIGASIKDVATRAAESARELLTLQGAAHALGSLARTTLSGVAALGKGLLSLGAAAVSAAAKLAKISAKGVLNGVKKGLNAAASSARNLMTRLKQNSPIDTLTKKLTGIKGMLVSRIKRTFISYLFNQIKESFNELAKFDARFDQSVSNLRNRTSELGANVMAAFGGLIRQIEPYITKMIETVSAGVTKINAVLTALRGESTMQVAVRRTESYAESLDKTAASADKAKAAQEKLNATLTSYDEIHKLDAPAEDQTDTSAAADEAKTIYQNVPVDSILGQMGDFGRKIADQIVQGIKTGDWQGAGDAIARGLNALVGKIDEKLRAARPKAEEAARNLADLLNGIVAGFDGYGFGEALADGLNLGIGAANEFLKRFDFYELGATIGDGITGAVRRFEWDTAGEAIGNGINGIINTARGIIEHTDWRGVGHGLATGFNNIVSTIDWVNAAQTLSEGVIGLLNTISQTIREIDWQQLGQNVATFIRNVDWSGVAKALFEMIGAILGGLAGFIWGLIKDAMDSVKKWWYNNAMENGKFSMEGFMAGIKKALKNIGAWIKKNIFQPFVNAFKDAFGISSPSKEMEPYGEFVSEGILQGIKTIFTGLAVWVKNNMLEPFTKGFKQAFRIASGKAQEMIENGRSIAEGIKGGISSGWTSITTYLDQKKNDLKLVGEYFSGSIKQGISNTWHTVKEAFDIDSLSQLDGSKMLAAGSKLIGSLKEGITGGDWDNMVANIWERFDNLTSWFNNEGAAAFRDSGAAMAAGLNEGLMAEFETAQQQAQEHANTMAGIQAAYGINRGMQYSESHLQGPAARTLNTLQTIKDVAESIDGTEVEVSVDSTATVLDKITGKLGTIADKLSAIARTFQAIGDAFPDMTAVPVPAAAIGAIAPARTRVTDDDSRSRDSQTAMLLERLITRIEELEEAVAERPIHLESRVVLEQREIGKATADYNTDTSRVTNGNGGANRW